MIESLAVSLVGRAKWSLNACVCDTTYTQMNTGPRIDLGASSGLAAAGGPGRSMNLKSIKTRQLQVAVD